MLKDITLGQYFPGSTVVHRLDPRTKLLMVILFIVALFTAEGPIAYLTVFLFLGVAVGLSRIPPRTILKGLKPLVVIICLTGLLNLFYTPGTPVVKFWVLTITQEGIFSALFMIWRILMLITGTFMLTYTTSPIALTDGLERLMAPLSKVGFPAHELAMIMTIALRFIPTLLEEADKIMKAQLSRGADLESGNVFQRAKAMVPILVPLFISAFRRADELAMAMESRCYHGGEGRTRMAVLRFARRDGVALGATLALVALILWVQAF